MNNTSQQGLISNNKPAHSRELLLSRQAIREVVATLHLSEEQEVFVCRQLINKIEDIIESL